MIAVTAHDARRGGSVSLAGFDHYVAGSYEDYLAAILVLLAAGPIAEIVKFPDAAEQIQQERNGDLLDSLHTADALAELKGLPRTEYPPDRTPIFGTYPDAERLRKEAAAEAEKLLRTNWPTVERVARALLRNRLIRADDLDDLIAGRTPNYRRRDDGATFRIIDLHAEEAIQ